jgi:hypothetical protein
MPREGTDGINRTYETSEAEIQKIDPSDRNRYIPRQDHTLIENTIEGVT